MTARRLLQIVVYGKRCRIGGKLTLDDLADANEPDHLVAITAAMQIQLRWPNVPRVR